MIWADFKETIKRNAAAEQCAKIDYSMIVPFTPSAESMAEYYNSSCYKGD